MLSLLALLSFAATPRDLPSTPRDVTPHALEATGHAEPLEIADLLGMVALVVWVDRHERQEPLGIAPTQSDIQAVEFRRTRLTDPPQRESMLLQLQQAWADLQGAEAARQRLALLDFLELIDGPELSVLEVELRWELQLKLYALHLLSRAEGGALATMELGRLAGVELAVRCDWSAVPGAAAALEAESCAVESDIPGARVWSVLDEGANAEWARCAKLRAFLLTRYAHAVVLLWSEGYSASARRVTQLQSSAAAKGLNTGHGALFVAPEGGFGFAGAPLPTARSADGDPLHYLSWYPREVGWRRLLRGRSVAATHMSFEVEVAGEGGEGGEGGGWRWPQTMLPLPALGTAAMRGALATALEATRARPGGGPDSEERPMANPESQPKGYSLARNCVKQVASVLRAGIQAMPATLHPPCGAPRWARRRRAPKKTLYTVPRVRKQVLALAAHLAAVAHLWGGDTAPPRSEWESAPREALAAARKGAPAPRENTKPAAFRGVVGLACGDGDEDGWGTEDEEDKEESYRSRAVVDEAQHPEVKPLRAGSGSQEGLHAVGSTHV